MLTRQQGEALNQTLKNSLKDADWYIAHSDRYRDSSIPSLPKRNDSSDLGPYFDTYYCQVKRLSDDIDYQLDDGAKNIIINIAKHFFKEYGEDAEKSMIKMEFHGDTAALTRSKNAYLKFVVEAAKNVQKQLEGFALTNSSSPTFPKNKIPDSDTANAQSTDTNTFTKK